jgi:hypothetical protein
LSWKYPPFYSFRQFIIQQYKEKVKSFTGDDCKYFATERVGVWDFEQLLLLTILLRDFVARCAFWFLRSRMCAPQRGALVVLSLLSRSRKK